MLFKKEDSLKKILIGKKADYKSRFICDIIGSCSHYKAVGLEKQSTYVIFSLHFLMILENYYYEGWFCHGAMAADYELLFIY